LIAFFFTFIISPIDRLHDYMLIYMALITLKVNIINLSIHINSFIQSRTGTEVNDIYPRTRRRRCWVHKTANILDRCPRAHKDEPRGKIHEIYMAKSKEKAMAAYRPFISSNKERRAGTFLGCAVR
jgi:hypothetical protein